MSTPTRPTVDRLRADIDAGWTGDKIPASDPAMAPLGTDDEAAGAPPSGDAVAQARRTEAGGAPKPPQPRTGPGHAWVLIVLILVLIAIMGLAGMLLR
jgi:hypothetical protein